MSSQFLNRPCWRTPHGEVRTERVTQDVRAGGTYRFVFGHPASEQPMEFFGRYIEVTPYSRLVWTNDEGAEGGAVTTVTFQERGADTLVVMHNLYPSKDALDAAIASGSTGGFRETFEQLDELLATLGTSVGRIKGKTIIRARP